MMLPLAIISIEQLAQLGLGGVAIWVLSKLQTRSAKDLKDLTIKMMDEVNKRDERYIAIQEKTLTALIKSSEVLEKIYEKSQTSESDSTNTKTE